MIVLLVLLVLAGAADIGHASDLVVPSPVQYPASTEFRGTPAVARPATRRARKYRTVITRGAEEGANFAGHFTIVIWGCGTSCYQMSIVDAVSGEVFDTPFEDVSMLPSYPIPDDADGDRLPDFGVREFSLTSRLLLVSGCLNEDAKRCGGHYYEWTGRTLRLLTVVPFPSAVQLPKQAAHETPP